MINQKLQEFEEEVKATGDIITQVMELKSKLTYKRFD